MYASNPIDVKVLEGSSPNLVLRTRPICSASLKTYHVQTFRELRCSVQTTVVFCRYRRPYLWGLKSEEHTSWQTIGSCHALGVIYRQSSDLGHDDRKTPEVIIAD